METMTWFRVATVEVAEHLGWMDPIPTFSGAEFRARFDDPDITDAQAATLAVVLAATAARADAWLNLHPEAGE